jgi:hypothetical protein
MVDTSCIVSILVHGFVRNQPAVQILRILNERLYRFGPNHSDINNKCHYDDLPLSYITKITRRSKKSICY